MSDEMEVNDNPEAAKKARRKPGFKRAPKRKSYKEVVLFTASLLLGVANLVLFVFLGAHLK